MADLHKVKLSEQATICDFVHDRYRENMDEMAHLHRSWALTLAWTRGYQNYDFDKVKRTYVQNVDRKSWRPKLISNFMLPLVRKMVARYLYLKPIWDTIPATPDDDDIQIADIGAAILRHTWQQLAMDKKLIQLLFWQENCASAFLKVGWDAEAGELMEIGTQDVDDEVMNQTMQALGIFEKPETLKIPSGNPFCNVVSPFNMILDKNATVFEDCDYCIECNIHSIDWIADKFGNDYKKVSKTTDADLMFYPYNYSPETRIPKDGCMTYEIYIKRNNGRFKKGCYAFYADKYPLISPRPLPYAHGELPYGHFVSIVDPSNIWGTCVAEQVRPNQARYNKIESLVLEQMNLMSSIQWLNPASTNIKEFNNKPGAVITFHGPQPPQPVQPRAIPSYIERSLDRVRMAIQDTASSHDVSEAKADPSVRSGKAVHALQEADDSVNGPNLLWFDSALGRVGRLLIQTISEFVVEDRTLQITGEFKQIETLTYNGAMLQGKNRADYWQVRTTTYGRDAQSRHGREAHIIRLIEIGLLNPVADKNLILTMLGTADTMSLFDERVVDKARQWKEIQRLLAGEQVRVSMLEDHQTHLEAIKKWIAGSKRDQVQPQQLQAVINHANEHMQMQALEAMQQASMLQGLQNVNPSTGNGRGSSGGSGAGPNNQPRSSSNGAASR